MEVLAARQCAASVIALAPPWMSSATTLAYGGFLVPAAAVLRLAWPLHARTARWERTGGLMLHGSRTPAVLDTGDLIAISRSISRFPLLRIARAGGLRPPLLPAFERIHCPVVLVWGTSDRLAPLWMSRRWMRAIPHAKLVTLPGFPHIPQLRDPDRVADLILDLAAGLPGTLD